MNKLKITIVLFYLLLTSCENRMGRYPNSQCTWVVTTIKHHNKVMSSYWMTTTDTTDYATNSTWVMDSIGKFEVGDTVVFNKR